MLETLDLSQTLTRDEYVQNLIHYQLQLRELAYQLYAQKRTLVVVYEGSDAGGKGGNIKRVTERLDPRGYEVHSIAAPKGEDATHHYLWRFWRRLRPPDEKQILIFDRSWYGRVLVERVEGFCTEEEWKRAYREINAFERQLVDFGNVVVKFWIHISKDEQLRRFREREHIPHKQWKLTDEDWRNREKWDQYGAAVEDMLLRTSTLTAPWTIVEGNQKWFARTKALRTLVEVLSHELNHQPADPRAAKSGDARTSAVKDNTGRDKEDKKMGNGEKGKKSKGKGKGKKDSTKGKDKKGKTKGKGKKGKTKGKGKKDKKKGKGK